MSTTRIADLPNLSPDQSGQAFPRFGASGNGNGTTYVPIAAHPNPFESGEPTFKLPSRDIPTRTTEYLHDESIVANHIPTPVIETDPICDMERAFITDNAPVRSKAKRRAELFWDFVDKFQFPMLAGILFFIFGTIRVSNAVSAILRMMHAIGEDGAPTVYGLAVKSVVFAVILMAVYEGAAYITADLV
jgi:hypothetical protein